VSVVATTVNLAPSAFIPLALGFFGLGVGYLIYGPQELFGFPARDRRVDITTGIWGIWMPGFLQFVTGVLLFVGLTWFGSFTDKPLYMAAVAFTAYGVHWWAIGLGRAFGADPRPNGFMAISFAIISALGIVVFFKASDAPVAGLFIGLTAIYVSDVFASLGFRERQSPAEPEPRREATAIGVLGERSLGFFHLGTGLWLMYLTWAAALNASNGLSLPL